jgi:hypothetical protein
MSTDGRVELASGWTLWPTAALRSTGMPFELLESFAAREVLEQPPGEPRNALIRTAAAAAAAAFACDETVREALVWQNPALVDNWLGDYADRLSDGGPARLPSRARREVVIARYAQRYCARNESIGFFGPVAWARFTPGERDVKQVGDGGIRRRTVSLETWAVAALADSWRQENRILPHLPVRLDAATSTADGRLWLPRRAPADCAPVTARLLAAVDGRRDCDAVLAVSAAETGAGTDELWEELLRLEGQGAVRIGFRVPFGDRPDAYLRRQVEQVQDGAVRADLLHRLDGIIAARESLQNSRGPKAVRAALGVLADRFADAGCAAAAAPRQSEHARTLAYVDCRRDTDVQLGDDVLDELRAPLGVLLDSARWLSNEVADAVANGLLERYRRLKARRDTVTLSDLQFAASDLLSPQGPAATVVREDFQLRWAEILPQRPGGEMRLTTDAVRPLVGSLFPAGEPRWAAARQHSPDLLLGRAADGTFRWVLGELHVALNTLESRVFRTQCDDPDELVRLTAQDMAGGRVAPLYPLDAPEVTSRTYPPLALDPPGRYRYWSYAGDEGHPEGSVSVAGTDILVREQDGKLIGEVRGGDWCAPVLEFFGEFLTAASVNLFQLRVRRPHLPRVLLDDVVICRESWSQPVTSIPVPPPGRKIPDRGYQEIRDWAVGLGMPRHVFVRTPLEKKPFYVDFCAPLLLGNFVRAVRRVTAQEEGGHEPAPAWIDVVEMLPRPEELWLNDAAGRRYTAELRAVAVDNHAVEQVRVRRK